MIKFQQSQALTSHFENFWSIVQMEHTVPATFEGDPRDRDIEELRPESCKFLRFSTNSTKSLKSFSVLFSV